MTIAPDPGIEFDIFADTVVIGAGACGMIAGLSAQEMGDEVVILERDAVPAGSTALSAGLIPAAGTAQQRAAGIEDNAEIFADDIMRKADNEPDKAVVAMLAERSAESIDWMTRTLGLPLTLVDDFDYPGHSARRMHGLPSREGSSLMDYLRATCEARDLPIVCNSTVTTLFATRSGLVTGVEAHRPDGSVERIGCAKLVLACNGFGGDQGLVQRHMPQISGAVYFGHSGNQGDALRWGADLGAATRHLGAFQGHGNVAHPHGILITWAVITEGGFQVNTLGERFWNEAQGYSEAAQKVLAQPGGTVWTIFDERIAHIARQFTDFREAEKQGAILQAESIEALAAALKLPHGALADSFFEVSSVSPDPFGRIFSEDHMLAPPYCAVKVTGALFHTQGGLDVTPDGRVKRRDGGVLPNLFAAGGAACGVSGRADLGYLSGNGLLSAVVLGRVAGQYRLQSATAYASE